MYALPRQIFIANDTDVGDLASNVDEKPCMTNFRWVMFVVDVLYLVLMAVQRCVREKFPSERFDGSRSTMIVHICCGLIIIYMGCVLHLQNEANPITRIHDASSLQRHFLYYILALATITHSVTVVKVSSKVMGERRITLPLPVYQCGITQFYQCSPSLDTTDIAKCISGMGECQYIYICPCQPAPSRVLQD